MNDTEIQFFSLFFLSDKDTVSVNMKGRIGAKQAEIYLKNAVLLAKTINNLNCKFVLLTNNAKKINDILKRIGSHGSVIVEEIPFDLKIPSNVKFYSAHFKICVFSYLAKLDNSYMIFCDLDMFVAQDIIPSHLQYFANQGIALAYDITPQDLPLYGSDTLSRTKNLIYPQRHFSCHWFGGEFLAGTNLFFNELSRLANEVVEQYIKNIEHLHHIGDEAITSCCLELMMEAGTPIYDAGQSKLVTRYWNARTKYPQPRFECARESFMLHLPADKTLLAKLSSVSGMNNSDVRIAYEHQISSLRNLIYRVTRRFS